jgi:hypothetical protein
VTESSNGLFIKSIATIFCQILLKGLAKNYPFFATGTMGWIVQKIVEKITEVAFTTMQKEYGMFQIGHDNERDALNYSVKVTAIRKVLQDKNATDAEKQKADQELINEARKLFTFNHIAQ